MEGTTSDRYFSVIAWSYLAKGTRQRLDLVIEQGFDLPTFHTREPFHKLLNRSAVFAILEERRYRNSSAAKDPGSADPLWVALNCIKSFPVCHEAAPSGLVWHNLSH